MNSAIPNIAVRNLTVSFAGAEHPAVNNVSFQVQKGKTLAIVGESGSGKTLTAWSLLGLLPKGAQRAGEMDLCVDGRIEHLHQIKKNKGWQWIRGREIGMVFQEPMTALNPIMKVGEQLKECILSHQALSGQQAEATAMQWLQQVQMSNPLEVYHRYPHQLSGGQKQRIVIAMAMCNHPALLIADEPTTALDATVQAEVIKLMQSLLQDNTAMIFITHDLALASHIADEVLVMHQGVAVEYGAAATVLTAPNHPYTKALLSCRPSGRQKGYKLPIVSDFLGNAAYKATMEVPLVKLPPAPVSEELLLQVRDVRVWFTTQTTIFGKPKEYYKAVDNVSFNMYKGEVLGLVGESGSGKSTLSRCLMGLEPAQSGHIFFNGQDLATLQPNEWKQVRRKIQLIFQDPYASLNPRMTVGEAIMEPMIVHNIMNHSGARYEAQRLLDAVQLPSYAMDRYPHQFSGGQRQRIGIARALALRPQLLICDESVSALDVSVQAQILNLLKDLQKQFDLSYLFISHDLSVVHYISDWVMVMQQGKIVESGQADHVLQTPENDYTQRLINAMIR